MITHTRHNNNNNINNNNTMALTSPCFNILFAAMLNIMNSPWCVKRETII